MRKKFLAWITTIMMIATMVPTMAFADGGGTNGTVSPAHTKVIKKNDDGTYSLKLDVKGAVSSTTTKPQVDVVIIADVSGSMTESSSEGSSDSRLAALKSAAKKLTSALMDNSNVDARFALVKYSGEKGKNDDPNNDAYVVTSDNNKATWTVTKSEIDSRIGGLTAGGGTNCQAGLKVAREQVLNSVRTGAQKIVIFMSDGIPTYYYNNNGSTAGAGNADADTADYYGTPISGTGSCSSAAYTEAAKITNIDKFYTIGIAASTGSDQETFLKELLKKPQGPAQADRKYYQASNTTALEDAFKAIAAQVTEFKYTNVTITDGLSQYVDIVGDNPELKITVTDKDGNDVTSAESAAAGMTASYNKSSKTVTLDFADDYSLKDGYTYSVEFKIKPSAEAEAYFDSNSGYPDKGDAGTDWTENISAGKDGFDSNTKAEITYKYQDKDGSDTYPDPVITVNPKVDVTGTKIWIDDSNKDQTRPDQITLKLYRSISGGQKTEVTGVTPTWTKNGNTWTYKYEDLPKIDAKGNVYTYTVEETGLENTPYEATYDNSHLNITNKLGQGETEFSGEKVWKDSDGKAIDTSKLPASIEIELLQNGKSMSPAKKQTVTPDANGKWTYKFENLPKYNENGERYQYSVKEVSVDGYGSAIDTTTGKLTNTYNGGEKVSVEGTKTWKDVPAGATLPTVTIILNQNDKQYDTTTVVKNSDGTYSYKFTDLPKYDQSGTEYKYTVEEKALNGYESTQSGNNFENKYTGGETKEISGTKTWKDVPAGASVPEVTIVLKQNGTQYKTTKVVKNSDGTYSYKFTGLPTYDPSGTEYQYTVEEKALNGYESTQSGNNFTNTYTGGDKTKIGGTKTWVDVDEAAALPTVTIELYRSDNEDEAFKTTTVKRNTDGTYSYEFTDLPTYDPSGNKYAYEVKEVVPDGYESVQSGNNFENKYTGGKTKEISGTKTWKDVPAGASVPEVTIVLKQNGTQYKTTKVVRNSDGTYSYKFSGLPTYDSSGTEYQYTVEENMPNGYESTQSGNNFENKYTGGKTKEISGTKTWKDVPAGASVPEVTIVLKQNGTQYKTTKVVKNSDGTYSYKFSGLPTYDPSGTEYQYTVEEKALNGYESTQSGNNFENKYTGGKTKEISGTKTWKDVPAGASVPEVTIVLKQNGTQYKTTKVVKNSDGTYSYKFSGLPTYDPSGTEYQYTVEEKALNGYESTQSGNNFENKYTGGKTKEISGTKTWKDVPAGASVPEVTIVLKQNGTQYKTTKVVKNSDGTYSYKFSGLPTYDPSGTEYQYTVEEKALNGYESTQSGNNFENKYTGGKTKEISGTKTWKDVPAGASVPEVTIVLKQNGTQYKTTKVVKNSDGTYSYKFTGLPTYDPSGTEYQYTVEEKALNGYESTQSGNNFENKYTGGEAVDISGTKTWANMPSDMETTDYPDVTVVLSQNGSNYKSTVLKNGATSYSFTGLPKYNTDGEEFVYTVNEIVLDGYTTTATGTYKENITNTYTPGTVSINGVKNWTETGDSNTFPEVTVELYRNGTKVDETTISNGATSYSFTGLDKLDTKGNEYLYTVKEIVPNGYEVTQGQGDKKYELTNKYTGGETEYSVEKTWAGISDGAALPAKVTVDLYQDNTKIDTADLTVNNNWKHTFNNLKKYRTDGTEFSYSVKEVAVPGYTTTIEDGKITNTFNNEKTTYTADKEWKGVKSTDALPAKATIELYKDGSATGTTADLTAANNWTYTFEGLDMYKTDGTLHEYTVQEVSIDGYKTEYSEDGKTVINTFTDEKTTYTVNKKWAGVKSTDKLPAKVTVKLYKDGSATDKTADLTADKNWTYTFEGLDMYKTDGTLHKYTVQEVSIDGYKTEYSEDGKTVTNTYNGDKSVNISGTKTWIDPEGTTHPEITIELYRSADGIDEALVDSVKLANGITTYEFTGLEKFATNGKEYKYTVKEKTVEGYTTSYAGDNNKNITNTIEQDKINISGTKTWIDADGSERPDVSVQLYRDGDKYGDAVKISSDNTYKFENLDKYDLEDGHIYEYTVEEVGARGYISTIDGYDITNSKLIKAVEGANDKNEVKVGDELTYTIKWTNASDEAVTATITDKLTKGQAFVEGSAEGAVVETEDGVTTVKWENITVDAKSTVEKSFKVMVTKDAEETVNNKASIKVGNDPEIDSNTTEVTPKIDISGEKIWEDNNDEFKLRPDSVKITLIADDEETDKTTEATKDSNWKYSFKDLPLYEDGEKIVYSVKETPVENYLDPEYKVVNKEGDCNKINIINSIDETIYSWVGDITLNKTVAVKVDKEYAPQKVTGTFYFALFSDKDLTKRSVVKSEDGIEKEIGIEKLELKNAESGTVTFKDIPAGTIKEPVKYYVAETDENGKPVGESYEYTPEFSDGSNEVAFTVKDHKAEMNVVNVFDNKVSVSGQKTWVDDNNKHNQRPEEIIVILKQNDEDYRDAEQNTYTVHASKDTNWAYTFENLPKFDENGDLYEYSVDESFVNYYSAVIDGMDITNTFDKDKYFNDNPATITITKETLLKGKGYDVNDVYYAGVFVDKDHTTLLADEEGAFIIPLALEDENEATYEFQVPYLEDGSATYYITEVDENGIPVSDISGLNYKASVEGGKVTVSAENSDASVTFTNNYEEPKVPKTGDSIAYIWVLAGLMAIALAAAAWMIFGRRRAEDQQ